MSFLTRIDKDEIKELPLGSFEGSVTVISDRDQLKEEVEQMVNYPYIGFDTETRPSFKKGKNNPVSLAQFAVHNRAWLVRLTLLGKVPELDRIVGNLNILKIGLAVREDLRTLAEFCSPEMQSFVDLQTMVQQYGIQDFSLKKMTAIVLGIRISKSQQLSNWDAPNLSESQIRYAATDAWATFAVYNKLMNHGPIG